MEILEFFFLILPLDRFATFFFIYTKAYDFVFMQCTINVKVLHTNSAYYKKGVVFLLAALKYLVEERSWMGFIFI